MNLRSILTVIFILLGNLAFLLGQCLTSFTSDGNGDFASAANWVGDVAPPNPIPPGVTVTISNAMTNSGILENNGTIIVNSPGSFANLPGAVYRGKGTFNGNFINQGTVTPGSTVVLPTLVTTAVTSIAGITAISGGTICYDGGEPLAARGVCWNTSPNPTVALPTKTSDAGNPFTSNITGLTERTIYYVRAYATNSAGTSYGNELSFTTNCGPVTFTYNGSSVTYGTAFSAGRCWLDRNLGASQVATASNDAESYGDLFQWGRLADGHQVKTSGTSGTLSGTDDPGHDDFILINNTPWDWRNPQNSNLWQGAYGVNNPCPSGYRIPTEAEFQTERSNWSSDNGAGAFASPLKLPMPGYRIDFNGSIYDAGNRGVYWFSDTDGTSARELLVLSNAVYIFSDHKAYGNSVRCIKDDGPAGIIGSLDCGNHTITGTLTEGVAASGVSASIPYTDGNGGSHAGQTVTSTGVTGLTAYLYPGVFNNGAGNLIYTISGTPLGSGTATFALSIGGQSCDLNINVACNPGFVTQVVEVTSAGGKIWMDRNLGAHRAATSSTDAPAYGYLYQWGRLSDGHQCRTSGTTSTLSTTDNPGHDDFIISGPGDPGDWRSPQNTDLWQGMSGVNNPCPAGFRIPTYTELENERLNWSSNNTAGAFDSPLKFTKAGYRYYADGNIDNVGSWGRYWSSTIYNNLYSWELGFHDNDAVVNFYRRAYGYSVRCIKDYAGTIGSIDCNNANITGTLTEGVVASGVSASVPYTGGNGGSHSGQTIGSKGVTGLTATTPAGYFANGNGSLTYTITGTPLGSGSATFELSIGGQSCYLSINVSCNPGFITEIIEVTSAGGKIWMDRNLGAHRAATSSTDAPAYGYLYQWGRLSDGHQCRASGTTPILAGTDNPGHDDFITNNVSPEDWRSPQNNNLWQGVNGINNPCPNGYRLPTYAEWEAERGNWIQQNASGAYNSPLKLPLAGERIGPNGLFNHVGVGGLYHSSTVNGNKSLRLAFNGSEVIWLDVGRSYGFSVRCIKDYPGTIGSLNCSGATITGSLTEGVAASGVSASVPYTGGNGGSHSGQTIVSTGVTGLTATTPAGYFANGNGSLIYNITGTPLGSGTATFALNIGGKSCNLNVPVACNPSFVTQVVEVTSAGGKIWMDRNLGAHQAATSNTDAPAYGYLYQWGRLSDGHQCRTSGTTTTRSTVDVPGHDDFITHSSGDWRNPRNDNLWQGVNGINNPCPAGYRLPTYAEWEAERLSWSPINASGAYNSPLKLTLGGRRSIVTGVIDYAGSSGVYWSSTVGTGNDAEKAYRINIDLANITITVHSRGNGMSVRCIKDYAGTIGSLNCSGATITGTLTEGVAANGVSASVPYTGGNGGSNSGQTVESTGVTGLTATTPAGYFANGNGSLTYSITGTPLGSGTAIFALNIGGQSCNLNINVACYQGSMTTVVEVTSAGGKIWMDRNLGAGRAATSSTDADAYGYLYQWGRLSDGHQCRNSGTTTTLSGNDVPGHGNLILTPDSPYDWRSPQNADLWQGINGTNNPCPTGFRIPTGVEMDAERQSWSSNNANGAFASPLKLPVAGSRRGNTGADHNIGTSGYYWSSTASTGSSNYLFFNNYDNLAGVYNGGRSSACSVRCIKN